jgi:hypothetical protein
MVRKRPCRICRRWFRPDPRAGERQRTCGTTSCQAERRRRAVAAWRARHPDYDREDRLRRRLQSDAEQARGVDPMSGVDWGAARNAVGLEVAVVIEETSRVLATWTRNAVSLQVAGMVRQSSALPYRSPRNDIGLPPPNS